MDLGFGKPAAPAQGGADGDIIKETTTAAFAKDVLEASRQVPVVVDFWAPWCEPCKQFTPILEKVVRSHKGKVKLVKINIDQHPGIAGQLRVQSIPTVYAFRDGRPLDGFMGAQPESAIKAFVERLLGEDAGADAAQAIEAADKALEAGDLQGAAEVYAAVLQQDAQNVAALAGLAKCYLKSGDLDRAEQTIGLVPPDKREAGPVANVRAALELARTCGQGRRCRPARGQGQGRAGRPSGAHRLRHGAGGRAATRPRPSTNCSKPFAAIASGTRRPRASSW